MKEALLDASNDQDSSISSSENIFKKTTDKIFNANLNENVPSNSFSSDNKEYKVEIAWLNVVIFSILHITAICGLYVLLKSSWRVLLFFSIYLMFGGLGITAGAHRLWAHRCYKANLPLRIFLMLAQSSAHQNSIYEWVRDHRVHHKFTDTNADPHNSTRGFFFSHIGWLLCKKHPDVKQKGKTVDMSDLVEDPVVNFQKKYFYPVTLFLTLLFPVGFLHHVIGIGYGSAFLITVTRYIWSLNVTWLVNSAAHIWGMKPYDRNIRPTENKFVSIATGGEGWHNYHHVFPWDYKAAELGDYTLNSTTCFIDIMAKIGWAFELRTASRPMIKNRISRTGDGSWKNTDQF
ncbi:acyl-CoA Delta-9 desaturase-like [Rhynchophorus ferrugineus]|uniref:acyl-CoA Delta-9 desaturase-like n=1 Tax=Rhynchophorus ferrugineus TaxID=354439 RepID=UPI003FCCF13C